MYTFCKRTILQACYSSSHAQDPAVESSAEDDISVINQRKTKQRPTKKLPCTCWRQGLCPLGAEEAKEPTSAKACALSIEAWRFRRSIWEGTSSKEKSESFYSKLEEFGESEVQSWTEGSGESICKALKTLDVRDAYNNWWYRLCRKLLLNYLLKNCFLDMRRSMTTYFFFWWLHIETGWVIEGINSKSTKTKNKLIKKFKTQSCLQLFGRLCTSMSINTAPMAGGILRSPGIKQWNHQ